MLLRRLSLTTITSWSTLKSGIATLKGRATFQATREFLNQSNLKMSLLLKSDLAINPVIHGSPRHFTITDKEYYNVLAKRAILINRSNCIVVYDYRRGFPWAFDGLHGIVTPENNVKRESLVTVANLGLAASSFDLYGRLADAVKNTGLQQIDVAIFEINDDIMVNKPQKIQEAIKALSDLVMNGSIQSYGIKVSVSPYIHHNPPVVRTYGEGSIFPSTIEEFMAGDGPVADIVLYNISPTSFQPATYPMLTGDDSDTKEEKESENSRKFTRVSCDPLICLRGGGKVVESEEELAELAVREAAEGMKLIPEEPLRLERELNLISGLLDKQVEATIGEALDVLCPALKSTPRLQDKALRTVLSVGIDAVMIDAELSSLMGKLQLAPSDMLLPSDTENVFGSFTMPEDLRKR